MVQIPSTNHLIFANQIQGLIWALAAYSITLSHSVKLNRRTIRENRESGPWVSAWALSLVVKMSPIGRRLCSQCQSGFMCPLHCTLTSLTGTSVNVCYATLHTCKCTSGEPVIVLCGCFSILHFIATGKWCCLRELVCHLKASFPCLLKQWSNRSGCCVYSSDSEPFIFHVCSHHTASLIIVFLLWCQWALLPVSCCITLFHSYSNECGSKTSF